MNKEQYMAILQEEITIILNDEDNIEKMTIKEIKEIIKKLESLQNEKNKAIDPKVIKAVIILVKRKLIKVENEFFNCKTDTEKIDWLFKHY